VIDPPLDGDGQLDLLAGSQGCWWSRSVPATLGGLRLAVLYASASIEASIG
jgi:hypothetical protein